ncbi:MAG: thioredoxin domain-containing protein, partial [Pseudomonadota bacterium]
AATQFIHTHLWRDGVLASGCQGDETFGDGYLDDYAFMADALLSLLEVRFEVSWLHWAIELTDTLLERFSDRETGALFFTADNAEALIYRTRPIADDATPAGNAIAARVLIRLGYALAESRYLEAAERILLFSRSAMTEFAQAHVSLIEATQDWLAPMQTLVLRGEADALSVWQRASNTVYAPHRWTLAIPSDTQGLPDALAVHNAAETGVVAYLCDGTSCRLPMTEWQDLAAALKQ